jgi:lathosterol oxidase
MSVNSSKLGGEAHEAVISKRGWNHTPAQPIQLTPIFEWPPAPRKIFQWLSGIWLGVSVRIAILILSIVTWFFLQPDLARTSTFDAEWIAQVYLRNLALMCLVAGGLHLWLYRYKIQGNHKQFDTRDLSKTASRFTFGNQVHDNVFWTLASGVTIWTSIEVVTLWGYSNGYVSFLDFREHPFWFVGLFLVQPIWGAFHFYCIHRALHWPPLYRVAHSLHHRNSNVGPWSGMSMHPIEHLMYLSGGFIHWVIASHPIHFIFHMQVKALEAVTSHAGHEHLVTSEKGEYEIGDFFHQLHHRYLECNYGTVEMPLDKWFGTFHSGTESDGKRIKLRKRNLPG